MTPDPPCSPSLVIALLVVGGGAAAWALFLRGDDVARSACRARAPSGGVGRHAAAGPADPSGLDAPAPAPSPSGVPRRRGPPRGPGRSRPTRSSATASASGSPACPADSDAVGRTNAISGSATIAAAAAALSVTAADFSVDMTTLASDRQMRDNRLRNDGIQTDSFPTSTFKLTSPVALPTAATTGTAVDVTLHGDLTLHGVTKSVDIPAKAQVNGSLIQVQGSLDFPFSDYAINAPNIGGFVSVEDHGTLEFLVNLAKG